jgi:nucleoside-diphosphate-sugar epimerase
MSRVLVTGAAGNIGRALTRRLLADGRFELRASDQRDIDPKIAEATEVEIHRGDLRDLAEARNAIDGCSQVIHLAAIVGGIGNFNTLPYTLSEMNSALCNAVYRAAIEAEIERFVYISSSMVYERATVFPTPEDYLPDCPTPDSAYGYSKLTGEVYARAANEEFGLPFTICRPGNAYGPGELPSEEPGITHVIPDLFGKVLSGQRPLQILGSGRQTRTFTYIDDVADGIITAMSSPAGLNDDFNITGSEEVTIAELAQRVWEASGEPADEFELEPVDQRFRVDVQRRILSGEKAQRVLGWEPAVDLVEGLRRTAEWMIEERSSSAHTAARSAPR